MEIQNMVQDLVLKSERLSTFRSKTILKREMLDWMLQKKEEPRGYLLEMSQRAYVEMIDEEKLFLPFTPGELVKMSEEEGQRSYVFTWGCYDFTSNRPYLHIMTFTQDERQEPLEMKMGAWREFLEAVRAEGSRAPDVAILALGIDDALESVHPKIVKRLCVGPLYSRLLADYIEDTNGDAKQAYFHELLRSYAKDALDAVLFVTDEMIFSKSQQVTRSILAPRGKVREIFAITTTDPDCFLRRASVVNHSILMPHWVYQEIEGNGVVAVSEFGRYQKITYDPKGGVQIHGVES